MPRYRMDNQASGLSIELTDIGGHEEQLMEALGECQSGQCSCPTDQYEKLAEITVEHGDDAIRLRLVPKPGEELTVTEIAACLDYTTAKVAGDAT